MVLTNSPVCDFGLPAKDFALRGTNGQTYTLDDFRGDKGTLVIFMCNHCPYVKAILPRLFDEVVALEKLGIKTVGINSNDAGTYPEDSFEGMQKLVQEKRFTFPYLLDDTQLVAREYNAVCTPDFFGFNAHGELQYRGRFSEHGREEPPIDCITDLYEGMKQVAETGQGPEHQYPSIGCSIKWRSEI